MNEDYDKENDIFYLHFGKKKTKHCVELFDGQLILDFDEDDTVVGIEIFGFMEQIRLHDKKMKKLLKQKEGEGK